MCAVLIAEISQVYKGNHYRPNPRERERSEHGVKVLLHWLKNSLIHTVFLVSF